MTDDRPWTVAQTRDELATRLERVEQTLSNLQKDVQSLNKLLRSAFPPSPVSSISPTHIKIDNAPTKGALTAKIALIEYSDFECPFCGQHANTTYRDIQKHFVDNDLRRVRILRREQPAMRVDA